MSKFIFQTFYLLYQISSLNHSLTIPTLQLDKITSFDAQKNTLSLIDSSHSLTTLTFDTDEKMIEVVPANPVNLTSLFTNHQFTVISVEDASEAQGNTISVVINDILEQVVVENGQVQKSGSLVSSVDEGKEKQTMAVRKLRANSQLIIVDDEQDQVLNISIDLGNVKFSLKKLYQDKSLVSVATFVGINLSTKNIQYSVGGNDSAKLMQIQMKDEKSATQINNITEGINVISNTQFSYGSLKEQNTDLISFQTDKNNILSQINNLSWVSLDKTVELHNLKISDRLKNESFKKAIGNQQQSVQYLYMNYDIKQNFFIDLDNEIEKEQLQIKYYSSNLSDIIKTQNGEISTKFIKSKIIKVYLNDVTKIVWDVSFKNKLSKLQNSNDIYSFLNNYQQLIVEKTNDIIEFIKEAFLQLSLAKQLSLEKNIVFDQPEIGNYKIKNYNLQAITDTKIQKYFIEFHDFDQKSLNYEFVNFINIDTKLSENSQFIELDKKLIIQDQSKLITYDKDSSSIIKKDQSNDNLSNKIQKLDNCLFQIDKQNNVKFLNDINANFKNSQFVFKDTKSIKIQNIVNNKLNLHYQKEQIGDIQGYQFLNEGNKKIKKQQIENHIVFVNQQRPLIVVIQKNNLLTDFVNYKIEFVDLTTFNLVETFNLNQVKQNSITAASRFNDFVMSQQNTNQMRTEVLKFKVLQNVDINSWDLEEFQEFKDKVNADQKEDQASVEHLPYPPQVHQQSIVSKLGIKQIIPVYTRDDFYPANWLVRFDSDKMLLCGSVNKIYQPNVQNTEINKNVGIEDKLQLKYLNKQMNCTMTIPDTKNMPLDYQNFNQVDIDVQQEQVEYQNFDQSDGYIINQGNALQIQQQEIQKNITEFPKDLDKQILWTMVGIGMFGILIFKFKKVFKF